MSKRQNGLVHQSWLCSVVGRCVIEEVMTRGGGGDSDGGGGDACTLGQKGDACSS